MTQPPQQPPPTSTDGGGEDDYSASATLIHFDRPLPLLRGPIPASPTDDPTLGPYVLAFPNPKSFFSALESCESKLLEQCSAAVRIGCSIAASDKCQPPWWKKLFGGPTKIDYKARNQCEEREMAICLEGSMEKCEKFAKEKCEGPFGWARVGLGERRLKEKEEVVGRRLIGCVSGFGVSKGRNLGLELVFGELNLGCEVGCYVRGSEILEGRKPIIKDDKM